MIMEYQKIMNCLKNILNQPSKCRNKINNDAREINCINREIKFKTIMLKSNFCDKADAPINYYISEIGNTQIGNNTRYINAYL